VNDQQYLRLARTGAISTYMQTYRRRRRQRRLLKAFGLLSLIIATLYLIAISPQPYGRP